MTNLNKVYFFFLHFLLNQINCTGSLLVIASFWISTWSTLLNFKVVFFFSCDDGKKCCIIIISQQEWIAWLICYKLNTGVVGKYSVLLFTRNKETTAKSMTDFFSLQKLQCMHKLGRLARLQQRNIMSDREKALCPHLSKGRGGG